MTFPLHRSCGWMSRALAIGYCVAGQCVLAADGDESVSVTASPLSRGPLSGEQAVSYASGLLVVFGVLAVLVWAARWMQRRNTFSRGGMRVVSSIGLGGKERLVMVDVEGERMLVGVAAGGVSLLRTLEQREELAERTQQSTAITPAAQGWLRRTLQQAPPQ